jgi:hypothetical protein
MLLQRIPELTALAVKELQTECGSCARPDKMAIPIQEALDTLFKEANHCESCESSKYRQGKADALAEIISNLRTRAGNLFADRQDKEAEYLREMITPLRLAWNEEIQQVEFLNTKAHHTCTLDGTQRWMA